MSESSRSRENAFLALIGISGLVCFFLLYGNIAPSTRLGLEVNKWQARDLAGAFLAAEGYDRTGYDEDVFVTVDNRLLSFMEWAALSAPDRDVLTHHKPVALWEVIFRHPEVNERFHVYVAGTGEVTRFQHALPRDHPSANLEQEEARSMASTFLHGEVGMALGDYRLIDAQTIRLDARSDHIFKWEGRVPGPGEARLQITGTVAGDGVSAWERSLEYPRAFTQTYTSRRDTANLFDQLGVQIIVVLLIFLAIAVLVIRFKAGELSFRNATIFAALTLVVFLVTTVNLAGWVYEDLWRQAMVSENRQFYSALVYALLPFSAIIIAGSSWLIWASGESLSRELWPAKLRSVDAFFAGKFFNSQSGLSITRGFALGGLLLGLWFLAGMLLAPSPEVWPIVSMTERLLFASYVPHIAPILYGVYAMMMGVSYALLFFFPFLVKRLGSVVLAILLTVVLFDAVFGDGIAIYSRWTQALMAIAIGPAIYLFLLRYDLLTVATGLIVFYSLPQAMALSSQPAAYYTYAGLTTIAVLGVVLVTAAAATMRGEKIDERAVTPSYFKHITERERMKMELDIARRAQLRMLPQRIPHINGLQIEAFSTPSREVGGDYYDIIPLPDGQLCALVGDVSGKGMPAALYMTLTKGFVTQAVTTDRTTPRAVLSTVNRNFHQAAERSIFITLFYCIIDPETREVTYCRAGHNPALLYSARTGNVKMLWPAGLAIGLDDGAVFDRVIQEETLKLEVDDVIVIYSDGLVEGRNETGEAFGEDRLLHLVRNEANLSAKDLIDRICEALRRFAGNAEHHDDLTCVVIKFEDRQSDAAPPKSAALVTPEIGAMKA